MAEKQLSEWCLLSHQEVSGYAPIYGGKISHLAWCEAEVDALGKKGISAVIKSEKVDGYEHLAVFLQ